MVSWPGPGRGGGRSVGVVAAMAAIFARCRGKAKVNVAKPISPMN